MIKKTLFVLGVVMLLSSVLFLCPIKKAFAQEETSINAESVKETPQVATESPKIKYELAYAGMLPDNPLYKIKVLRDRIYASLISDNNKKINFYLLQADKGISATARLVEKNNIPLAGETALKAEHNMTLISQAIRSLPGKPDNQLFITLSAASLKHQEVLNGIIKKLPKDQQKTFITVLGFSKSNLETIEKMQKKDPSVWSDWENWKNN